MTQVPMPKDKILLEGMVFYGYHGVSPEEKSRGQRFVVDVEMARELQTAGISDDLKDTTDYGDVYRLVKDVVEGPSRNVIEAVAEQIARDILSRFDIDEVRVKISKPGVTIKGSIISAAAVEIVRQKLPG